MKKFGIYSLIIYSLVLFTAETNAQQINNFTVQQAVDYANKNSVHVKNALLDVLIQKQVNRDITSIALPQINGSAGVTYNIDIPVQTIPNFISPATYKVLIDEGVKNGNGQTITYPAGGFGNLLFPFGSPWVASAEIGRAHV